MKTLPFVISEHENEEIFIEQFERVFSSKEALCSSVVYTFTTVKDMPRVFGKSNILYIGKTKNSLKTRYLHYAKTFTQGRNWINFPCIIKLYGPISINYSVHTESELKQIEQDLLTEYFKKHCEYPPHNHARS